MQRHDRLNTHDTLQKHIGVVRSFVRSIRQWTNERKNKERGYPGVLMWSRKGCGTPAPKGGAVLCVCVCNITLVVLDIFLKKK